MKISYNWVKQFLAIDLPAEEVASILTDLGLEVEGTTVFESVKGGLEGVVVGEVKSCEQHPNADRLKLTQVAISEDTEVQIVCGAPNVAAGQKVPVATVGTALYDKEGSAFKINKSKIRGEESFGMICAEDELGLGSSHDGIMVLDAKWTVGTPCSEVFKVEKDVVFEIGLTPNRADAMSHMGVARDLKAACIQKNIPFEWSLPEVTSFHVDTTTRSIPVVVKDSEKAPQYYGITLSDLTVKPSPDWLQNRLKAIGIAPKNNIVDATNYVLHELGQPLHAFDADKIAEKVVVQTLPQETPFTTLDGKERALHSEDLMICDAQHPHCLAGVFGGMDSGVTEQTKAIFLESAYFNPVSIRKSAKRHGLNTDASFRFERGIDLEIGMYALKRAALLIKELAGGHISSEIQEYVKTRPEAVQIFLSFEKMYSTVGESIPKETLNSILNSLEIEINNVSEEGIVMTIPSYRVDVTRQADVIEEILRVYGYNTVKETDLKYVAMPDYDYKSPYKIENAVADLLTGQGFYEMLNNSIGSPENKADDFLPPVRLLNPLGSELSQLRQSLLFNALEVVAFNINRQNKNLKLFEFGKVYGQQENDFAEEKHLSIVVSGAVFEPSWDVEKESHAFYFLKGIVEGILEKVGVKQYQAKPLENAFFEEGLSVQSGKKTLINFGKIAQALQDRFVIDQDVYCADIHWDTLLSVALQKEIKFEEIAKFPLVRRDFALLLDTSVRFEEIETIAFQTERKILKSVNLFDVYEGKSLPKGKKSYGVGFTFSDAHRTLTDVQVDKVMERLQTRFEKELNAQLR